MVNSNKNEETIILVPRNFHIVAAKVLGTAFLFYGFLIFGTLLFIFLSEMITSQQFLHRLYFMLVFLVPIALGAIGFFIPERYRERLLFDKDKNLLRILKRCRIQEFSLDGVISIVSRIIAYPYGGVKHYVILNKDTTQTDLFREQCAFRGSHWVRFSEKLSLITTLPLIKEYWAEGYDGKLRLIPREELTAGIKRGWLVLIPGILPFVGAAAYTLFPSRENFVLFGLLTILIGNILPIIVVKFSRAHIADLSKGAYLLIINAVTHTIKMILFYAGFAFMINGAKLPGILE